MSNGSIQNQIEILREQICYHERKYFINDQPEISDQEYDQLMKDLERLEAAHPELITQTRRHSGLAGRLHWALVFPIVGRC